MRNSAVISGSSGWGDWCFLNDAAYESVLWSITYSYFCSSEPCTRRQAGGQSFSWETLRRKQWRQWHVPLSDLLLNLCTLINLSTVPARASTLQRNAIYHNGLSAMSGCGFDANCAKISPQRDWIYSAIYKRVCQSGLFSRSLRWVWV